MTSPNILNARSGYSADAQDIHRDLAKEKGVDELLTNPLDP